MFGLNFHGKIGGGNNMNVTLHCTDRGQNVTADILNHREGHVLEVALNTVKLRLMYNKDTKTYVGSMAGLEFTVAKDQVPVEENYDRLIRNRGKG